MVFEARVYFFNEFADGIAGFFGVFHAFDEQGGGIGQEARGIDLAAVGLQHRARPFRVAGFQVKFRFPENVIATDFSERE